MAGIYIHIPFCKKACHYCDFHFSTSLAFKNEIIDNLLLEIQLQKNYLQGETVDSIYFGGGTPSILSGQEIALLMQRIKSTFAVAATIECTLEANPDDLNADKITAFKEAGINRFSLGIQSFFDDDLQYMNRSHDAAQAERCIQLLVENSITNFSVDLIFGFPLLSDEKWKMNIERMLSYPIPHISCYAMTVEPKTALASMIAKNKLPKLDEKQSAEQYIILMEALAKAGYEHYEISNFAMPGLRAKHNSSYWKNQKYLGIGPSAHSYNRSSRQWNVSNNAQYIKQISQGLVPSEMEILSIEDQMNERIMISLRTIEGLHLSEFEQWVGDANFKIFKDKLQRFLREETLQMDREHTLRLTQNGKLYADGIAAALFF